MESKALPPAKINPAKLLKGSPLIPSVKKISVKSVIDDNRPLEFGIVKRQVIRISDLIKTNTLLKAKEEERKKKESEKKRFAEREEKLEKPKEDKGDTIKLPSLPRLGFLDRIKKFLFNIFLGYISLRLLPYLPKLAGVVGTIVKVQDTVIDVSGKILNGLVSFVDKAYEVHDKTRKFLGDFGGENFTKAFDGFIGAMDNVITASIVAAIAFGELRDMSGPGGGDGRPKKGFDKFGRKVGTRAQERYLQRYGEKQFAERFGQKALRRIGTKGAEQTIEKGVLRTIVKRIPIIGALIDFALNYFVFKEPLGEAAFRAAGSTLLGFLGGAIGSIPVLIPFGGPLIGATLGGVAGDALASLLYDGIFKNQQPNSPKIQGRAQGGQVTRGGKYTGPIKRTIQKPQAKRTLKVKPTEVKPGQSVGGKDKIEKIFPEKDQTKNVNPLGYMKSSYKTASSTPGLGGLIGILMKAQLGERPSSVDYQSAADGLTAWVQRTVGGGIQRTGGAYAEGGEVDVGMFGNDTDMKNVIAKALQDSVAPKVDDILNDLKKQLELKAMKEEKNKVSTSGQEGVEGPEDFSGSTGAEKTMHYLMSQGLTAAQAAGIAGNLQQESGFNPDADNGSHHGIAQWDKQNRWPRVSAYISSVGRDPNTLEGQLVGLKWEAEQRGDWREIKKASSAKEASVIWLDRFERSGEKPGMRGFENRMTNANNLLAKYGNYVPPVSSISTGPMGAMSGNLSIAQQIASNMGLTMTSFNTGKHAQGSLHYQNRAMDFSNDAVGNGTPEQLAFAKQLVSKYGSSLAELIYTPLGFSIKNGKRVSPLDPSNHYHHVHVAFAKGGKVHGFTRAILGEKGPEFVIDADSTRALEENYPGFLNALNKSNYQGALNVIRSYASYEQGATIRAIVDEKLIPVPIPVGSSQQSSMMMSIFDEVEDYMASSYKG